MSVALLAQEAQRRARDAAREAQHQNWPAARLRLEDAKNAIDRALFLLNSKR